MMTITPSRRAAAATAAALAVAGLGLAAGYAWGSGGTGRSGALGGGGGGAGHVAVLPAALAAATAGSAGPGGPAGITVSGTGTVSGTPDTLRLAMGVSVTSATVTAALDTASAAAGRVLAALKQHGVADKDLQTSNLSVQAQYADGAKPAITGYQVTESLTATLRSLKDAGNAIGTAAQAGGDATRVDGVSLDLTDTGPLVAAARVKAFDQAKDKAKQYAQVAGADRGGVVSISEVVNTTPPLADAVAVPAAAAAAPRAVPMAPGSEQIGVTVTVVFGLG
jgi:uncharacterized protein YggE